MTDQLRKRLIRLAHEHPELRSDLLPILAAQQEDEEKDAKFEKGKDVPLKDMPKKLQENAKNPPPEVKALKEKMKGKKGTLDRADLNRLENQADPGAAEWMGHFPFQMTKVDHMAAKAACLVLADYLAEMQLDPVFDEREVDQELRQLSYKTCQHILKWSKAVIAESMVAIASEKEAGCEKLPAGPMRDNCEKKSKGGDSEKKDDAKDEKKDEKSEDKKDEKKDGKMPKELLEKFKGKKKASVRTASDNSMDLELFPKSPLPETASQVAPKFGGFSWD